MGVVAGFSGLITLPIWLAVASDEFALSSQMAGTVSAVQLASAALSSALISRLLGRINLRKSAMGAALLIVIGNVICALTGSLAGLMIGRILSGVGEGATLGSTNAWIARSARPVKTIAIVQIAVAIGSVLAFFVFPRLAAEFGSMGVFFAVSGFAALAAVFVSALREEAPAAADMARSAGTSFPVSSLLGIGVFLCLYAAMQGVWAFLGKIGEGLGVPLSDTGDLLAIGALLALAGPIIANRLSTVLNQTRIVTLGLLASAVATLLIAASGQAILFSGAVLMIQIIALYNLTAIFSFLAILDPSGKAAAAAPAAINVGSAIGPLIAGFALAASGFAMLGWFSAGLYALAIFLAFASARRMRAANGS
jgi:predicted MFS family arabinose efflux permease